MMGPDPIKKRPASSKQHLAKPQRAEKQIVTERKRQKLITIPLPHRHKRVPGQFEFIVQLPFPEQVVIIQFISDFTQPQLGPGFYFINSTKLSSFYTSKVLQS